MTKDEIQKARDALSYYGHSTVSRPENREAIAILDATLAAPADSSVVWQSVGELEQAIGDAARFRWLEKQAYQGVSWPEKQSYQGVTRLKEVLWCIRGLFGKDNQTFGEAIDEKMKGQSHD